jgi:glutamate--cysteine ligase
VELREWGGQVLAECERIAEALDTAQGTHAHRDALAAAVAALDDPASLPSARVLREMQRDADSSYARFTLAQSHQHRRALQSEPLRAGEEARLASMAKASIEDQRKIEASDKLPFEAYRQAYLSHAMLRTN